MFADKLKYLQGYVSVRLTGYAPERFLNLCSNHDILIWNLEYKDGHYQFCISVRAFRQLKPILRKTKTRLLILQRSGLPFFLHRYRKRKLFFGGILFCGVLLYLMSLFIWNIEVQGNLHRTDSTILRFLAENQIQQGVLKGKLDCTAVEELLRSQYEDVIWASVKIQGTRLVIDIQENLLVRQTETVNGKDFPSDLVAEKEAEIYRILTRQGTPLVERGSMVKQGDVLVTGKLPIYNDSAEVTSYQYCRSDADILGITTYTYQDVFSLSYEDKIFTGREKKTYHLRMFQKLFHLPGGKNTFAHAQRITTELPVKIGKNFYLPFIVYREVSKEYKTETKIYTKEEATRRSTTKFAEFCKKLEQKGVQIVENNVIIVAEGKSCIAQGELTLIEPIGVQQSTEIEIESSEELQNNGELQQEGQITDESDRNDN